MLTRPLDNAGEYSYRAVLRLRPEDKWAEIRSEVSVEVRTDQGPQPVDSGGKSPCYTIDKHKPVRVTPNALGVVVLNILADSSDDDGIGLSMPTLQVHLSSMEDDTWFDIYPDEDLHKTIANLPEEALWKAHKNGDFSLKHGADQEACEHVQRAVQNLARSACYTSDSSARFSSRWLFSPGPTGDSDFVVTTTDRTASQNTKP